MSESKFDNGLVPAREARQILENHDCDYVIVLYRRGNEYGNSTFGKTAKKSGAAALIAEALLKMMTVETPPENFQAASERYGMEIKAAATAHAPAPHSTVQRIRAAQQLAHSFAQCGIEFVPMPITNDEQRERLLAEAEKFLSQMPEGK